jgi:hypothetical protein
LSGAGRYQLGLGHALPFGGRDEQRRSVGAAEHAGEPAAVQFNALEDRSSFSDADAPPVGHIGVPDSIFRVDADTIRDALAEVGPPASVGQSTVLVDSKATKLCR